MEEKREQGETRTIDTRDNIKVVTDNKLITAPGLAKLSLKARKLLYLIMAQCRQTDKKFYLYEISPPALADKLGVDRTGVYRLADELTGELMGRYIEVKQTDAKRFKKYAVFSMCEYDDRSLLRFKLNQDMAEFLLGLQKSFTQAFLSDFLKMRSAHSMAVWHLMQREMNGRKPGTDRITFYLSLDELREVTGTQDKLKQLSQFKARVLDKAIQDIKDNCGVEIEYMNRRRGRSVQGFYFTARGMFDLTGFQPDEETAARIRMKLLGMKLKFGSATPEEYDELQGLLLKYNQMSIFDFEPKNDE